MKKFLLTLILGWCLSGPLYGQNLPGFPALEPLTTANVNRLELLAMLGRGRVYDVVWSQDGETVIAATDTGIWLYEAATPLDTPVQIVQSLEPVYEIAYTDDGQTLIGGIGREVKLWDAQTGEEKFGFQTSHTIRHLVLSADETLIATADEMGNKVGLWKADTGERIATIDAASVLDLASNPTQNQIAFVSLDGMVHIWDVTDTETPIEIHSLQLRDEVNPRFAKGGITFSADGTLLAVSIPDGGKNITRLWDIKTGNQLAEGGYGGQLSFSPDNRFLVAIHAAGGSPAYCLWNVLETQPYLEQVNCFGGFSHTYTRLEEVSTAFSPDSTRIVIADVGEIQVIDPLEKDKYDKDNYKRWRPYDVRVEQIVFTVDGASLFTRLDASIITHPSQHIWNLATGLDQISQTPKSLINEWQSDNGRFNIYFDPREPDYGYSPETIVYVNDGIRGMEIARLELNVYQIMDVAFSPDSRLLATAGRLPYSVEGLRIWSLPEGNQKAVTEVAALYDSNEAWSVAWGADSQLLFAVNSREAEFYRYNNKSLLHIGRLPFNDHIAEVVTLAINTDRTILAVGGEDNVIRLWGVPATTTP